MSDRVRMEATTSFHNALIEVDNKAGDSRPDAHTVNEGDQFSTFETHARELETAGYAKRVSGEAAPASEGAQRLAAIQTSATGAITSSREKPLPLDGAPEKAAEKTKA